MSRSMLLCLALAVPLASIWSGWEQPWMTISVIVGGAIAVVGLLWPQIVATVTGQPRPVEIPRPAGVSERTWSDTRHGTVGAFVLTFPNDRSGWKSAEGVALELAVLGYWPVVASASDQHMNIGRTAVSAAAAVAMASAVGIGLFKSSRNAGHVSMRFERQ